MKKLTIIALMIAMLAIGLIGGWFAAGHYYNRWIESYMKTSEYNNLSFKCRVLIRLRAGKTNEAAGLLETLMDGDIIDFGSFVRDAHTDEHRAEDLKLIRTVRDYRAGNPWNAAGYPEINKSVAEIFALVSTNQ